MKGIQLNLIKTAYHARDFEKWLLSTGTLFTGNDKSTMLVGCGDKDELKYR